jgi:hypothetical protein
MSARKHLAGQLSQAQTVALFSWIRDQTQMLMLCPAVGAEHRNREQLGAAEGMLKAGLNSAARFREYNRTLMQLEWGAYELGEPTAPGSYILWHVPSGGLAIPTDVPKHAVPVVDPTRGWMGPCSGLNADQPAVLPASRLLSIEVASNPAWFVSIGIPVPTWEAACQPLKAFLPSLKKQFREIREHAI